MKPYKESPSDSLETQRRVVVEGNPRLHAYTALSATSEHAEPGGLTKSRENCSIWWNVSGLLRSFLLRPHTLAFRLKRISVERQRHPSAHDALHLTGPSSSKVFRTQTISCIPRSTRVNRVADYPSTNPASFRSPRPPPPPPARALPPQRNPHKSG